MILKSLGSKQKKNQDVALQTEPECIEMKDVSTSTTDMFDCGDVTKSASENYGRILFLVKNFVRSYLLDTVLFICDETVKMIFWQISVPYLRFIYHLN
ncbi:hypothetical protein AVEN_106902-1 [Araneus ventricosus]|uniref:Uncharacterized protein n=1 Tax=Araneus ventricosus TaxID=182803 RepID=A0A4Y2LXI0_ARAVE|nr:hypothetical protein AVEN_106902-1 [Araneus ventricosus]